MRVSANAIDNLLSRIFHLLAIALVAVSLSGWAAPAARADQITDETVDAAMTVAKTPADHQALAAYFTSKAEAAAANAEKHQKMLASFTGKLQANMALHCKAIISSYKAQAKDYAAMAKEEEKLAKKGM
jgi:hypothetical protein